VLDTSNICKRLEIGARSFKTLGIGAGNSKYAQVALNRYEKLQIIASGSK